MMSVMSVTSLKTLRNAHALVNYCGLAPETIEDSGYKQLNQANTYMWKFFIHMQTLSLSLSHTHIHVYTYTNTHVQYMMIVDTDAHTHTHTHTHTCIHTNTCEQIHTTTST